MNITRLVFVGFCCSLAGCYSPRVPAEVDGGDGSDTENDTDGPDDSTAGPGGTSDDGSGTGGPDDTESGGTDGSGTADETGAVDETTSADETGGAQAPTIMLTVNGSDAPPTVEQASEVIVQVVVDDADGTVQSVELRFDGEQISAPIAMSGDTYTARFIISGADDNGTHLVEATATDDDGLTADASVNLEYELPNGGLIEAWDFDSGDGGNVLGIHPNAEGDELVWAGIVFNGNNQQMRLDRIVGPAWQQNNSGADDLGADVHPLANGGYIAALAAGDAGDLETRLRRYASNGTTMSAQTFDGSDNGGSNWPLGVEVDEAGDFYVLGSFVGPEQFESYLLKSNTNLTQEWKRSLSSSPMTNGMPFIYDFDVRPDGRVALVGGESSRWWVATMSADGDIQDQLTLVSEFNQSLGYDVAWTAEGDLVVAGAYNEGSGWGRMVRMYDDNLAEQWSSEGPANDDFAMAVTVDDHDHIAVASPENCTFDGVSRYEDCRLVLRSYDLEGTLRWQHNAEGGNAEFLGPLLFRPGAKADIEVDRYGYVYVSALHERPLGGGDTRSDWWAQRHHP